MAKLDLTVRYSSPEAAARAYASAAGLSRLDNATASAARLEAAGRLRRDGEGGACLLTEQPPQRRTPRYAVAEREKGSEEVSAEARAGAFRGPGAEVLSATRACLRAVPGATVTQVCSWLAGWPGLEEPTTEDLAVAALHALRSKGQAIESDGAWTLR